MKLIMITTMAGPELTADAGTPVDVNDKLGKALKAGGFARDPLANELRGSTSDAAFAAAILGKPVPVETDAERTARLSAENTETARLEAERIKTAKLPENVKAALDQLNPADDEDWTAGGKPSMHRVETLIGTKDITRAELDAMFPDFKRPADHDAGGELKEDGPTVADYVKAGYLAKNYPPKGYASKSTAEEIAAAIKAEEDAAAAAGGGTGTGRARTNNR